MAAETESGVQDQGVFPEWKHFLGTSKDPETASFIRNVVKRSGEITAYDREKIEHAIGKAISAVEGHTDLDRAKLLTDRVEEELRLMMAGRHAHSIPAIEEIQDVVETALIKEHEVRIAKAYILYRARHEAIRDTERLMLDIDDTMNGYLSQSDWRVKENANVNFSLGGLILHNSGTITANYWLKNIYPEEVAEAHRTAAFHIHDLSMFSGYCAGWSIRQLIAEGLGGVPDKITSKPARHLSTLIQQIVNFLGIMQNEWAGAQAFSSFDTYLAPFVKKDSPFRQGSEAVPAELHLRRQYAEPLGQPGSVHEHHARLELPGRPREQKRGRRRRRDAVHLRRMPEGNGHDQPHFHRAHARGRCGWPRLPVPDPDVQHHERLRVVEPECATPLRDDRAVRHALLPELHQLRPQSERRALDVLPPPARQARTQEARRRDSSARTSLPALSASSRSICRRSAISRKARRSISRGSTISWTRRGSASSSSAR